MSNKAVKCYNLAIKIQPDDSETIRNKAELCDKLDMHKKDVLYYNKALKVHDSNPKEPLDIYERVSILLKKINTLRKLNEYKAVEKYGRHYSDPSNYKCANFEYG